jgi:hypothetical protein
MAMIGVANPSWSLGHIMGKTERKSPKYRKKHWISILDLAAENVYEPRVGHP